MLKRGIARRHPPLAPSQDVPMVASIGCQPKINWRDPRSILGSIVGKALTFENRLGVCGLLLISNVWKLTACGVTMVTGDHNTSASGKSFYKSPKLIGYQCAAGFTNVLWKTCAGDGVVMQAVIRPVMPEDDAGLGLKLVGAVTPRQVTAFGERTGKAMLPGGTVVFK